jgi:hypothetical protein
MKKNLKYFVSYAHKTDKLVVDFVDKFSDHTNLSKKYSFTKWIDKDIIIGEGWHEQMQEAIAKCDFGLLLLSSAYFNRQYIKDHELPHFIKSGEILKPIVPVGLQSFDLGGDLLGLEITQIYRYQNSPGEPFKFYSELRSEQRQKFIMNLAQKIHSKFG